MDGTDIGGRSVQQEITFLEVAVWSGHGFVVVDWSYS